MSDFSIFMAGNVLKDEEIEYVASKRIGRPVLDKDGKPTGKIIPEPWKLKAISSERDEAIRKECTKRVQGKRGQTTQEVDTDKYINKMCIACISYPNLNAVELQDSYGVRDAETLLKAMLNAGEYTELKAKVMEINGFNMSMEDLVDEAKN